MWALQAPVSGHLSNMLVATAFDDKSLTHTPTSLTLRKLARKRQRERESGRDGALLVSSHATSLGWVSKLLPLWGLDKTRMPLRPVSIRTHFFAPPDCPSAAVLDGYHVYKKTWPCLLTLYYFQSLCFIFLITTGCKDFYDRLCRLFTEPDFNYCMRPGNKGKFIRYHCFKSCGWCDKWVPFHFLLSSHFLLTSFLAKRKWF